MKINTEVIGAAIVDALPFSSAFAWANGRSIFLSKDAQKWHVDPRFPSAEYPYAMESADFSRVALTAVDVLMLGLAAWTYLEAVAGGDAVLGAAAAGFWGTRMAFKGLVHGAARRIMHGQLGGSS